MRLNDFDKIKLQNRSLLLFKEKKFPNGGTFLKQVERIPLRATICQYATGRSIHPGLKKFNKIIEKDINLVRQNETDYNIFLKNIDNDVEVDMKSPAKLRPSDENKRLGDIFTSK